MMKRVAIVIVNWRSRDYLRRCLQTVEATASDLVGQIVVVDGASFDGCGEMLAAEFPQVEFVQSQENVGFGRCNNLGFERVRLPIVLLLNPDTELQPGSLQALVAQLETGRDAGLVCGRLLNTDGTLQKSCVMALPTPLNQAVRSELLMRLLPGSRLWGATDAYSSNHPVKVEAVSGACMLLWSETFRRLGGFRPEYFMYAEDMDLCFRVHGLGLAVYHVPSALIVHHGGGSSKIQVSQFSTVMMRVANELYMRLNHGRLAAWLYRLFQGLSAMVRMALAFPACVLSPQARRIAARATVVRWWYVFKWTVGMRTTNV